MALRVDMGRPHRFAAEGHGQGLGDLDGVDAGQGGLLPVGDKDQTALGLFHRIVHIHHPVLFGHALADQPGGGDLLGVADPRLGVDLGGQGRDHRRSRRQLDNLEVGAVTGGDPGQLVAQTQGDGVTLLGALALGRQIDADIGDVGSLAQIVMAHHAVEIHGAGGPHVGLEIGDLVDRRQIVFQRPRGGVGPLQGGPLRQIEH